MPHASYSLPEITFESGWLLDSSLAEVAKIEFEESAVQEIADRLKDFDSAWKQTGEPLLEAAIKQSGLTFAEKDIKAVLICGPIVSHSHPLIINVRPFLKSCNSETLALSEFAEIVFHELLHILLQDNIIRWPTPVIEKLSPASAELLLHVHLLALQRKAYESIGRDHEWLSAWYARSGEEYHKAWQIVSNDEHYLALLGEIDTGFRKTLPLN